MCLNLFRINLQEFTISLAINNPYYLSGMFQMDHDRYNIDVQIRLPISLEGYQA